MWNQILKLSRALKIKKNQTNVLVNGQVRWSYLKVSSKMGMQMDLKKLTKI